MINYSITVALKLLQRHLAHLVSFMTSDFEEWHNMFSINITECSDVFLKESKSVREVSAAFYHAASQHTNATHLQVILYCWSFCACYFLSLVYCLVPTHFAVVFT